MGGPVGIVETEVAQGRRGRGQGRVGEIGIVAKENGLGRVGRRSSPGRVGVCVVDCGVGGEEGDTDVGEGVRLKREMRYENK